MTNAKKPKLTSLRSSSLLRSLKKIKGLKRAARIILNPYTALKLAGKSAFLWPVVSIDMMINARKGYTPGHYIQYKFLSKTKEERDTFLLHKDNANFIEAVNGSATLEASSALNILRDKEILLGRMGEQLGRDYIDLKDCSDEEFLSFVSSHPKFIAKPRNLAQGRGIQVFNTQHRQLDLLSLSLKKDLLLKQVTLLEEFIDQHEDINKIYPHCVNTIRIHTLRTGTHVEMVLEPFIRFGSQGSEVNSAGPNAIFVKINETDGILHHYGMIGMNAVYHHTDTNIAFKGYKLPYFDAAKALAIELAQIVPEVNFIGWDIAITNAGPVVVEGNGGSGSYYDIQQFNILDTGIGSKPLYTQLLDYFKKRMSLTEPLIREINEALFLEFGDDEAEPDIVIILGSKYCKYRVELAYQRFGHNQNIHFITCGGNLCQEQGENNYEIQETEAHYMQQYLLNRNVDPGHISIENESWTTQKNIEYSLKLIKRLSTETDKKERIKVGVVTGGFHMKRVFNILTACDDYKEYDFISVPAYGEHTRKDNWYTNQVGVNIIANELKGLGYTYWE